MYDKHEWAIRRDRHPVAVEAEILRNDGSKLAVTLTDFSDNGCCIQGGNDFRVGEKLRIAIPRMGHVRAQIRWSLPTSAGARFIVESDF